MIDKNGLTYEQLEQIVEANKEEIILNRRLVEAARNYVAVAHFSDERPRKAKNELAMAAIDYVRSEQREQD